MTPYLIDLDFTLWQGDVRQVAAHLPGNAVQTIVTSPPYFALRDYGTGTWSGGRPGCDHQTARRKTRYDYTLATSPKQSASRVGTDATNTTWLAICPSCGAERQDDQLGMEDTPADYVNDLVDVFEALKPCLKPDATAFINLGDKYENGELLGIPWLFALEMKQRGWRLFNDVIWVKPNGMTESVKRRFTKKHEHIFCFGLNQAYKFNQQFEAQVVDRYKTTIPTGPGSWDGHRNREGHERWPNPEGRNMWDWWSIPPAGYPDAHFAVFPDKIPQRCIAAGSDPGEIVLDPFMGSGTTARVARSMGRRSIGIELSETYCKMIAANTGQQSLLAT